MHKYVAALHKSDQVCVRRVIADTPKQVYDWAHELGWSFCHLVEVDGFADKYADHDLRTRESKLRQMKQTVRELKDDLKKNHGFDDEMIIELLKGIGE